MKHILHQVYQRTLASWLDKWQKRQARRLTPELVETALMLLQLNLDPLTQMLDGLYSPNPRGRPPFDPVAMLRALILVTLLKQTRIDQFAKALKTQPRLARMAGFEPNQTPAASTFYLFIDRLENGPFPPKCPHRVLPADERHGKHRRNFHQERAEKEAQRQRILEPVIALNPRTKHSVTPTGTAKTCNERGIPLCPGGLEMRRHSATPDHRIYFNCPVKRPTHHGGKTCWNVHLDECPHHVLCDPDSKMGPVVYVRTDQDPRYYPPMARDSQRFKAIMNLRSGCERSNGMKKEVHHLGERPCRSATHLLVRLYLVSIVEHVKAWLTEDRKQLGDDWHALCDHVMVATS